MALYTEAIHRLYEGRKAPVQELMVRLGMERRRRGPCNSYMPGCICSRTMLVRSKVCILEQVRVIAFHDSQIIDRMLRYWDNTAERIWTEAHLLRIHRKVNKWSEHP